jgi:hypothetical protein
MSLRSLSGIASLRDLGGARKADPAPRTEQDAERTVASGYADVLVSAIPTEVLGLYTFLVGVITGTITQGDDERLLLRWLVYASAIVFIVAFLYASYRRRPRRRRFPVAETLAAVVAFAAWGLAMPESPLAAELTGDDRAIWTAIITVAGVAVLLLLGVKLKNPAPSK